MQLKQDSHDDYHYNGQQCVPTILPPPPPPPPMPDTKLTIDLVNVPYLKPHMKMRTLNWRRIPKTKVLCQQVKTKSASSSGVSSESVERSTKTTNGYDKSSTKTDISSNKSSSICGDVATDQVNDTQNKNIWFLIAEANKSIKKVDQPQTNSSPSSNLSAGRSASRIKEMLESVRRRMAAVTAAHDQPHCRNDSSATSQTLADKDKEPSNILELIDFNNLENLFCLDNQPGDHHLEGESPNFVRRSSLRTNASSDSAISSNSYGNDSNTIDDDDLLFEIENILDSKKSLNVNIFLKQLKNSDELIDQVNREEYSQIGKEKLESLLKLLPDETEKTQLLKFYIRNKQNRLPIAERFLLQLITEVPNLKLRIKFMLLQEEYHTDLEAIPLELNKIEKAASEIRKSKMLRDILNLVLVTGNFLNTGGYAADAAGFSLDCLERLSEVRSNKPGVFLIHYLAELANKLKLEDFLQRELPNVRAASRVCIESMKLDVSSMLDKINELKCDTEREAETSLCDKTSRRFLMNLLGTLEDIRGNVEFLMRQRITCDLEETRTQLANYLCEDESSFKLYDCFNNILVFSQKLKVASDENARRQYQKSKLDHHHRSSCNLRRSNTINHRLLSNSNNSNANFTTRTPHTGRASLGDAHLGRQAARSPSKFSYFPPADFSNATNKRSSLGYTFSSSSSSSSSFDITAQQQQSQSSLSRTTSTFSVTQSSSGGSNNSNSNRNNTSQEYDELHDGLMRLLEDSRVTYTGRRASDCQSSRIKQTYGTYRRNSKLFNPTQVKVSR